VQAITRLELQLADMAIRQGKALILALNKSDAVPGGAAAAKQLQGEVADLLEDMFLPAGRLPVVLLSARHNQGMAELLDAVVDAYSKWNRK
jgi:GTP-binding protein